MKEKIGIDYINYNLTIISNSRNNSAILLRYNDIEKFLSLHEKVSPLKIVFEKNYIQIIDSLKYKSVVGIETNYWVCQEEDLYLLVDKGTCPIDELKNACALQDSTFHLFFTIFASPLNHDV